MRVEAGFSAGDACHRGGRHGRAGSKLRKPAADGRHGRPGAAHGAVAGAARGNSRRAGVAQRRARARQRRRVGAAGCEWRGRAHRAVRRGRPGGGAPAAGVGGGRGAAARRVARGGRAVGRAAGPADGGDAGARVRAEGARRVGAAAVHGGAAARGVHALLVGGCAAGRQRAGRRPRLSMASPRDRL